MLPFPLEQGACIGKRDYEKEGKRLGFSLLCEALRDWKKENDTSFPAEAHSQILQQALKDLDRAYKNFFAKRADFPRFRRKGVHDAFRYPQGFRLDEDNSRIFLPKIGYVRYRNSRRIEGTPKQVTVSLSAGRWFVSIQTEREVPEPVHTSQSAVGIDMGVARFATLSDGSCIKPLHSFRKHEKKLAKLQRRLAKRVKFSANWQKLKAKIQRLHRTIANVRNDFLHKTTTIISKNHALVVIEDLKVRNMSRSASGTFELPGKKLKWLGGKLVVIPPQYTSQTCSHCGCADRANRPAQAKFKCVACGFECNADYNAALNILAAGQAVSACGAGRPQAPALKQEPAYGVAR